MTLKVLIAEDHNLASPGLEAMLSMADDLELANTVDNGEDAVTAVQEEAIDVVLMDVNLGAGINGIEAIKRIKKANPDTKVLVLTMFTDPRTVAEAVKAGAEGYLSKGSSPESVIQAIHDVAEERAVLDPNVTEGVFRRIVGHESALTDHELEVLKELANGKSSRDVAERLHISEDRIKTYIENIHRRLDVRSTWQPSFDPDSRLLLAGCVILGVAILLLLFGRAL